METDTTNTPDSKRYSFSLHGESYEGEFNTREEAFKAAQKEVVEDVDYTGPRTVYTGIIKRPSEFLDEFDLAETVIETINNRLEDEVICDSNVLDMDFHKKLELGKLIQDFIGRHGEFENVWAIDEVVSHKAEFEHSKDL
jgi:hypothetical protein